MLDQVLLAFGAGDLIDAGEHSLQRAELCSSWAAVFSPIPGTPGMLSEVSPAQPHQVGDQLRIHAVALLDRLAVVDLGLGDPAAGAHHPHPVADQLVGVAVAGDDHRRDRTPSRLGTSEAITSSAS